MVRTLKHLQLYIYGYFKGILKSFFYFDENDKVIHTLNTLRFIFFIFIFVFHSGINISILKQPALAVSGFIILSGFLNGYIYKNKYGKIKFKDIFNFTKKRIIKFYPLHFVMFFVCVSYSKIFSYTNVENYIAFLKKAISNLLLIQSWINSPKYYFAFNGVAWFLSTYLFLTLMTIPMLYLLKKLNNNKKGAVLQIFLSIVFFIITMLLVYIVKIKKANAEFWIYVFPPARVFEYYIGMIYGNLIKDKKIKFKGDKIIFTVLEILSIVFIYLIIKRTNKIPNINNVINWRINQWIIPLTLLFIIFTYQKGYISKLFSFKLFDYLGKISMYMFMIHQPLIHLVRASAGKVVKYRYIVLYMLLLTIIISCAIDKAKNKVKVNKL